MEKTCPVCGKPFSTYDAKQKTCSLACGRRHAAELRSGFPVKGNVERNKEISRLRGKGLSYTEISTEMGLSLATVTEVCRRYGYRKPKNTEHEHERHRVEQERYFATWLSDNAPSFEYVSGYENTKGRVEIRCLNCGTVVTKSVETMRGAKRSGRKITCPHCKEVGQQYAADLRIKMKELLERHAEVSKQLKKANAEAEHESKRLHKTCPICGKEFQTFKPRQKYCCPKCKDRAYWKAHRKEKRFDKSKIVDKDITLEKLFMRDSGVCYLCGKPCNYDDFVIKDGTWICGDTYPSIDHVTPRAAGGEHAWANVRLAHRRCNMEKSDSLIA